MSAILSELIARGPVVTDGAWGTQLQARGLPPGAFPDLWNLQFPQRVGEVAAAYVAAGSRVILTNTFGANAFRLREANMEKEVRAINRAGVWISKNAANGKALVFASMGPTGRMLVSGDVTELEVRRAFAAQATALAEAGADAIVIETMSEVAEARAAIMAVRETGLPSIACALFDSGKEKDRTMMGETPEEVAAKLMDAGASAIGANCGLSMGAAIAVCRRLSSATSLPIWIKPNAGLPELREGRIEYSVTPQEFASSAPALLAAGAGFIGGCCGTTPDFIRALQRALVTGTQRQNEVEADRM